MFKIAIVSAAGGVGRSSLTANLAILLARRDIAVLALEFDPQNRMSTLLGNEEPNSNGLLADFLADQPFGQSALIDSEGVAYLPFGRSDEASLALFEQHLRTQTDWLKTRIAQIDYPLGAFLLMDTPRMPSPYAHQVMLAADLVLVVLAPDMRSLSLIPTVENTLQACTIRYVMNGLDSTRRLHNELLADARSKLQMQLSPYSVHRDEAIPHAFASQVSIYDASPDSLASHDLNGLLNWLLKVSSLDGQVAT